MLHPNENKFISAFPQALLLSAGSYNILNGRPVISQEASRVLLVASVFCLTGSLCRWLSGMIMVQEMLCFFLHHQGLHVKETVLLVQPGRI